MVTRPNTKTVRSGAARALVIRNKHRFPASTHTGRRLDGRLQPMAGGGGGGARRRSEFSRQMLNWASGQSMAFRVTAGAS